jgi:hypothetical protein
LGLVLFAESISDSLRPYCVLERIENSSCVRVIIRIFSGIPPTKLLHLLDCTV